MKMSKPKAMKVIFNNTNSLSYILIFFFTVIYEPQFTWLDNHISVAQSLNLAQH